MTGRYNHRTRLKRINKSKKSGMNPLRKRNCNDFDVTSSPNRNCHYVSRTMSKFNTICVIGLGYIGLPTASLLGTKGYSVLGVDISEDVVTTINRGEIHIIEPDLDLLVKSAVNSGNLRAATCPEKADIFIIAVPTPFKNSHKPDLSYVESATRAIAPYVQPGNLIILESTCPVGTTDYVAEILREEGLDTQKDVYVAHCPERVLPGKPFPNERLHHYLPDRQIPSWGLLRNTQPT